MATTKSKDPTCFAVYLDHPGGQGVEVTAVRLEEEAQQLVGQLEARLEELPRKGRPRVGYYAYVGPVSSLHPSLAAQL